MFKIIKKADIVLIILLLIAGLASSFFFTTGSARGTKTVVTIDGKQQKKCANGVVVPMTTQNQVRVTSFLIVRKNVSKRQKERDNNYLF